MPKSLTTNFLETEDQSSSAKLDAQLDFKIIMLEAASPSPEELSEIVNLYHRAEPNLMVDTIVSLLCDIYGLLIKYRKNYLVDTKQSEKPQLIDLYRTLSMHASYPETLDDKHRLIAKFNGYVILYYHLYAAFDENNRDTPRLPSDEDNRHEIADQLLEKFIERTRDHTHFRFVSNTFFCQIINHRLKKGMGKLTLDNTLFNKNITSGENEIKPKVLKRTMSFFSGLSGVEASDNVVLPDEQVFKK